MNDNNRYKNKPPAANNPNNPKSVNDINNNLIPKENNINNNKSPNN